MRQSNTQIGPYTLVRLLETHGLDEVWVAKPYGAPSSREVALKVFSLQNKSLEQANREASIWAEASGHPNILSFFEAGVYDDLFVMASEYPSGGSLQQFVSAHARGSLPYNLAGNVIIGILSALEHLHAKKTIHRDLKPAQVYLSGDTPLLAGFGLACRSEQGNESDEVVGTPAYMAPEAWLGKHSAQTDIWSVTVILYELLTGNLPFPAGGDITSLAKAVLRSDPPLPVTIAPQWREIITRGLHKDARNRYHTTLEMRIAVQQAMESGG